MTWKREALLSVLIFAAARAVGDTKIIFSELPAAVQTAAKQQLQGAQVVGASWEK
jgi:hypothetical protein